MKRSADHVDDGAPADGMGCHGTPGYFTKRNRPMRHQAISLAVELEMQGNRASSLPSVSSTLQQQQQVQLQQELQQEAHLQQQMQLQQQQPLQQQQYLAAESQFPGLVGHAHSRAHLPHAYVPGPGIILHTQPFDIASHDAMASDGHGLKRSNSAPEMHNLMATSAAVAAPGAQVSQQHHHHQQQQQSFASNLNQPRYW